LRLALFPSPLTHAPACDRYVRRTRQRHLWPSTSTLLHARAARPPPTSPPQHALRSPKPQPQALARHGWVGKWFLDFYAGTWFFTDNDEYYGGVERQQEPIVGLQAHVAYAFRAGLWLAFDANGYRGGKTTVGGLVKDDLQENSRAGLTLAVPIGTAQSIKVAWSTGATTRLGSDFDLYSVAWQVRWMD
jgi:hypothetical protein